MQLNSTQLDTLCSLAKRAAKKAGEIILDYSHKQVEVKNKLNISANTDEVGESLASQVVTEVDLKSQECILAMLEESINEYALGLLTEESSDSKDRLQKDYFWCIDPLDGTLFFTESRSGYSVSIALVSKNGEPVVGVVYNPVVGNMYSAIKGQGAYLNNKPWKPKETNNTKCAELLLYTDRSFADQHNRQAILHAFEQYALNNGFQSVKTIQQGGAVLNVLWSAETTGACYFKFPKENPGGGSLWDFAASACIANEAGSLCSDISGNPLNLNRHDSTFMNHSGVIFTPSDKLCTFIIALYQQLR